MTKILIPTCDRYSRIEWLTEREIDRQWPGHPPIVRCGESGSCGNRAQQDWGGIVLDAVRGLSRQGCDTVYLILDDHAPLGPCNVEFLNETLPGWMKSGDAALVSLNGSGQGRPDAGVPDARLPVWVERVQEGFGWRYTLHPAVWKVEALECLLQEFERLFPAPQRTAWLFEREMARSKSQRVGEWNGRCYRVIGARCMAAGADWPRSGAVRIRRKLGDGVTAFLGALGMCAAQERWEPSVRYLHRPYLGPYPLYWSGLMQRGEMHADAVKFLELAGCGALVGRLMETLGDAGRARHGGI